MQFQGAYTALITPFSNGAVDESRLRALIDWQIDEGIHGLVPCGSTGESATLSHKEHDRVIEICIEQTRGRVPILAGAGSNNTAEAIRLTRHAKDAGAAGALLITPYYNRPTQEGLYRHYAAIAEAVDFPLIPYNVPTRTGCNLLPATIARLAHDVPHIVGIKEATGDLTQISDMLELCPPRLALLTGDDFTVLPTLILGGAGVISVVSNIAPARMAGLYNAACKGDYATARSLHFGLMPLVRAMFLETNPIPVKTALALLGRIDMEVRLPLCPMSEGNQNTVREVLATDGLL